MLTQEKWHNKMLTFLRSLSTRLHVYPIKSCFFFKYFIEVYFHSSLYTRISYKEEIVFYFQMHFWLLFDVTSVIFVLEFKIKDAEMIFLGFS